MSARTAVVVDRQPLWLGAIEQVLATTDVEVVAKTTSFAAATRLVEQFEPELVVCEIATGKGEPTGLSWLAKVSQRFPRMKLIVFSSSDDPGEIKAALAGGAHVYVVKKSRPADVAVAVRQVYNRSLYLEGHQAQDQRSAQLGPMEQFGLTKRELEILRLTATGLSNREIAKQLWVTEQTVKFHLANIYRKLGVSNRTAASRQAQLHGLLPAEPERQSNAND